MILIDVENVLLVSPRSNGALLSFVYLLTVLYVDLYHVRGNNGHTGWRTTNIGLFQEEYV